MFATVVSSGAVAVGWCNGATAARGDPRWLSAYPFRLHCACALDVVGPPLLVTRVRQLFFERFGTFIVVTLTVSVIVAFLVFPSMMFIVGPEDSPATEGDATKDAEHAVDAALAADTGTPAPDAKQ